MRWAGALSLMMCVLLISAAPTTPVLLDPLADGALRYSPPAGWDLVAKSEDGLAVIYRMPDGNGLMTIKATPQDVAIPASVADQMAPQIARGIRQWAQKNEAQVLYGPRTEPDDRFLLKMRDRIRLKDGRVSDRVQIYRVMGIYLVHVAATALSESEEEAATVHRVAEELLDRMRTDRGVTYTVFPRTRIRIKRPVDWREEKVDRPNDLVAIYSDLREPSRRIIVRARIIPREARTDAEKMDALLSRMLDDERQTDPFSPEASSRDEQPAASEFLRKISVALESAEQKLSVQTRYLVVGDVLVSVRSVCLLEDAEEIDAIADRLAGGMQPSRPL